MHTLIISGGNVDKDFALDFIKAIRPDKIIAVDKGLEFAYYNQVPLDMIVGDFDSVSKEILAFYQNEGRVPIATYSANKDAPDTELAIEKAIAIKSEKISILGATGTRIDHMLGNLNCLSKALKVGIAATIIDANNHISLLQGETIIRRDQQFGKYVSFLPFGGEVKGMCLEGFKYQLSNYTLAIDATIGISNEFEAQVAKVSLASGTLIKIESRD
jgi:thiamine pyrophosphokinase